MRPFVMPRISLFILSTLALGFTSATLAQAPLPPDSSQLVLIKKVDPTYPPIAKAAHVTGTVNIAITLNTEGHITSTKVLGGPPMLAGAALEAVKQWTYKPVIIDGKTTTASTTVSVSFTLPAPHNPNDEQIARAYFPLADACRQSFSSKADAGDTARACGKAAETAATFSIEERFIERRSAYTFASTAYLRNKQLPEALDYARKAVAVIAQGHDDGSGSSAAYSVLAQAEASAGDLSQASSDLTKAEDYERLGIKQLADSPGLVKMEYIPTLRNLLNFHAQVLNAMGESKQADEKAGEAAKL